jgi:hypothetical protein
MGPTWSSLSTACSPGTWLADLGAREGIPFVLGHALYRQAIHGGKATHDQLDAHKMAVRRRGGMLPQASVYSAAMRATRALLRRRMPRMRTRAELLPHIQHTTSQDHLPEMGTKIASQASRAGVAERFSAPAGHKRIDVTLALMSHDDSLLRDMALSVLTTAQPRHANTLSLLRTVPGIGELLRLVLRDDIHALHRCPRGQAFVSYGRLVQGA